MSNLMNKLFKNKSTQRFILSLKTPHQQQYEQQLLPKVSPSLIPQQTNHFSLAKPEFLNNPDFSLNQKSVENSKSTESLKLYPNLPFGLNPIKVTGFDPSAVFEVEEGTAETEDDDAGKVWADSVKKKRKKKMNKHKYKKLRKRLRRKT
ncbi:hypothetical protein CCACVL1_08501 [Corchorus capsularis]|uniref:Small ribosomal subunit protein mS38 n=1 Tax=Corchorus capsularis TaxID=210143 RepID=A0A1R3J099_COCAP|nr:hypothetical protein CCACVL1_08501 [Corchorus capsularis]